VPRADVTKRGRNMSWFFDILWAIIGGAIIGGLARLILPGKQNISLTVTIIAGILGMLIGGFIAHGIGVGETRGIDWIRHLLQLGFGVVFVALAAKLFPRRGTNPPTAPPPGTATGYPT
jgi:uncharacterized membrane protein YeaQ/YmgE (transglycosylase-associated protein family)